MLFVVLLQSRVAVSFSNEVFIDFGVSVFVVVPSFGIPSSTVIGSTILFPERPGTIPKLNFPVFLNTIGIANFPL